MLLYTFGGVVVLILVFAGIAGWNMYRYGVEAEHAEDISNLNRLTTLQWQRWAQQSVAVLGFHAFFPSAVLSPGHNEGPVNGDKPLLLPPFNGCNAVFQDLLLSLLPELQQLVAERILLEVTLPEGCYLAAGPTNRARVWASGTLLPASPDANPAARTGRHISPLP